MVWKHACTGVILFVSIAYKRRPLEKTEICSSHGSVFYESKPSEQQLAAGLVEMK